MYIRIGKAATVLGVAKSTLRRWEKEKKLIADYRTAGGHRRYNMTKLLQTIKQLPVINNKETTIIDKRPRVVTYARVSGSKQRELADLYYRHGKYQVETRDQISRHGND